MPVHAFIFPGQGSQAVGMGRDLAAAFAAAREVFQEVDDTLNQKLSKLMFEGPGEELTLTENTQPALMAHSLAVLRVLEKEGGFTLRQKAVVVAGHSLGEYSRAGRRRQLLHRRRGAAAEAARPGDAEGGAGGRGRDGGAARRRHGAGGGDLRRGRAGARQRGRVEPATRRRARWSSRPTTTAPARSSSPAIARRSSAPWRSRAAKGVRRAMLLPVSAPFHCALMAPAADAMAEALEDTPPGAAGRAADRQRLRRQGHRSRRKSASCWSGRSPPRCAGASASRRWWRSAWTASSNSAPARCCPG